MISSSASVNPAVCVYHDSVKPFLVECLRKRKSRAPREHQLPREEGTNIMSALLCRRNPKSEAKLHAQQHPPHGLFEVTQLVVLEGGWGNLVCTKIFTAHPVHTHLLCHPRYLGSDGPLPSTPSACCATDITSIRKL